MSLFRHVPLSRKIILGILPLFVLFVTVSVILSNRFQEREMMEQAQITAHTYADIIKEAMVSMMVNNQEVDEGFLHRVNELNQFDSLRIFINVLNLRSSLLTPERVARMAGKHISLQPGDSLEREVLSGGKPVFLRNGDMFRALVPFRATSVCQECHAVPVGYTLGAADLQVSFRHVSEAATGNWKRSLVIFLAFTALAIILATLMFRRFVSKPIVRLVAAANEISRGNLDHRVPGQPAVNHHAEEAPADELHVLAVRFDEMRESLKEKINQLDRVNQHLSDRNEELEHALGRLRLAQEELVRTERLAVTGRMTAQLSHEINNPIHNIHSLLQSSLRKIDGNDPARELITVALEEVNRMAKLTRQMLDFHRGSQIVIDSEPVDIVAVIREAAQTNRQTLAQAGIRLTLDIRPMLPPILGSSERLKQVLLNLVLNARDAMPDGGELVISAHTGSGFVCVEVRDTGAGIPPEIRGRIFDPFFTTKEEVSGVGLGLFVSYGIVQQHNGTITVSSSPGNGTTFQLKFPVHQ
jgi:two-component system, NtrC family, sensor kinase